MSSPHTSWQPPSDGADVAADHHAPAAGSAPAPRYGDYGQPAAGSPSQSSGPQSAGPEVMEPDSAHVSSQSRYPSAPASAPGQSGPAYTGFSVAPKPGIIPLRPLTVSEILSGAFESLRANPKAMFIPAIVVMGVIGVVSSVLTMMASQSSINPLVSMGTVDPSATDPADALASGFFTTTGAAGIGGEVALIAFNKGATALAQSVLTGLLIVTISRSVLGRIATPADMWARVRPRVWALIGQSILLTLINYSAIIIASVIVGGISMALFLGLDGASPGVAAFATAIIAIIVVLVAGIIIGAFFWVRLSLSPAALVLENASITEAMRRSWRLTRGYFWRVLGIMLLTMLLISVIGGVIGTAIGMIPAVVAIISPGMTTPMIAASTFLTTVASAVIIPFSASVYALVYVDLRMRREGLDVELRRATAQAQ